MTRFPKALILSVLAALMFLPRLGETCGPFFQQAIFVRPHGPDRPMSNFARGRIGIILPTWWRAYLVVAYRYLESKPLSAAEQRSLLERWDIDRRIEHDTRDEAIAGWVSARNKYPTNGAPKKTQEFTPERLRYNEIPNCLAPAFVSALATLKDRAARFGAASSELEEWLRGQDTVFRNCAAGTSIPAQLPLGANQLLRADRAYQIAAAHFYTGQFETAQQEFQAIAADDSSPWHTIANYLVARTFIREAAKKAAKDQSYDPVVLSQAEVWLKAMMNDPRNRSVRQDAESLLDLVLYHLHPEQRQHQLGRLLAQGSSGPRFGRYLVDYTWLLDRFLEEEPEFPGVQSWTREYDKRKEQWVLHRYTDLKPQRSDDLSDWLMTVQSSAPAAKDHAVEKWRSTHSIPWLVAALGKLHAGDVAAHDLLDAAGQVPSGSSPYATVAYHRIRVAHESGDYVTARRMFKEVLAHGDTLPPSTAHMVQDEQITVATDFDDFQSHLWQDPVDFDFGDGLSGTGLLSDSEFLSYNPGFGLTFYGMAKPSTNAGLLPQLSPTAAMLLNTRIPLVMLVRVAQSSGLPENLRSRMAAAAWARAALLDEPDLAQRVAETAEKGQIELRPYVLQYDQAKTPEERKFVAAFTVLHFPGMRPYVDGPYPRTTAFERIDNYRDNWWCQDVGSLLGEVNWVKNYSDDRAEPGSKTPAPPFPAFLDAGERQRAATEWQQLSSSGSAARYLPTIVIAWTKKHPQDPRVPEALHLAVRATRYGCDDGKPNPLSREAFTILHQNYPKSDWAQKTPYWFQ